MKKLFAARIRQSEQINIRAKEIEQRARQCFAFCLANPAVRGLLKRFFLDVVLELDFAE